MKRHKVEVTTRKFGYFPASLRFLEKPLSDTTFSSEDALQIDAVERCWTTLNDIDGEVRYRYRVRCGGRRFLLDEGGGGFGLLSAV